MLGGSQETQSLSDSQGGRDAWQGRADDREESPPPLAQRPTSRSKPRPPGGPVRSPPSSQQAATCSYGLSAEGSSNGLQNPCAASDFSPCPGPTASQHRARYDRCFCAEHRDKCPVVHCVRGRQERQRTAGTSRAPRLSQVTLGASVPHSRFSFSVRSTWAPAGDLHRGAGPAPQLAPPIGGEPACPFVWEGQSHSRCTLHTTNHLLGSRYYSVAEFDALADGLRDKLGALAPGEPIGKEDFRDSEGNYDIQVMDEALSRAAMRERPNTSSVLRNWCGNELALLDSIRSGTTRAVLVHRSPGRLIGGSFGTLVPTFSVSGSSPPPTGGGTWTAY